MHYETRKTLEQLDDAVDHAITGTVKFKEKKNYSHFKEWSQKFVIKDAYEELKENTTWEDLAKEYGSK